jgi:TP901 family phage tail tape measure protein
MAKARTTAQNLGNALDLPGVSAAGAAAAMTELAKAGLTTEQSIDAARGALQLSIAAQTSEAEAATITANALLTFGLHAKEAGRVTDLLAGAANASSASMTDIAYALAMGGTAAKSAGVPIQDTITAFTMLANAGIKGSDAGTLLKTALARMTAPTGKAAKTMKGLGLEFFKADGSFVGMRSAVDQLQKKLGPLTTAQRAAALQTIFGADASRFATIAADQGTKSWDKYAKQVGRTGQAAQLAAAQNTGLGGALDNLQSTAEGVGLKLYGVIQPAMTAITKGVTNVVSGLPDLATKMGKGLGAIYDLVVKGDFTKAFRNAFNVEEDSGIVTAILWIRDQFVAAFGSIRAAIPPLVTAWNNIVAVAKELAPIILPVAAAVGGALLLGFRGLAAALPVVATALASVTGFIRDNLDVILAVTGAVGAFVAVLYTQRAITLAVAAVQRAWAAATLLVRGAILSAQVGMWLLNAAIAANPIGIIIALIIGLVAGFVILYKRNEAFRNLVQKVWAAIKTAIGSVVGWITGTMVPAIIGAWNWVINGAKSIWTNIVTTFNNVRLAIGAFISSAVAFGVQVVKVLTYPYRIAMALIIAVFVWLWKQVSPIIMGFIATVVGAWQRVWAVTVSVFNAVRGFLSGVWNAVVGFVVGVVSRLVGYVVAGWNRVAGITSAVFNRVRSIVVSVWNAVTSFISSAVNRARAIVARIFQAIYTAVATPVNRVKGTVSTAFSAMVSAIAGFVGRALSTAKSIGTNIINGIKSGVANIYNIGADIVNGLINGIVGMGGRLWSAITGFISSNVPEPVKKLLGISSPSRLFITFGRFVVQGFIIGITGSAKQVRDAGLRMLNNLTDLFRQSNKELKAQGIRLSERQQAALIAAVKRTNARLNSLAAARDKVAKRLASAQKLLADRTKVANEFRASLRESLIGDVNVEDATKAKDIINGLADHLKKVRKFQADMANLAKRGLNATYLQQIAEGGLSNAGTAAALASATNSELAQVNALQGQINSAASATASKVTDSLYGAGIRAAQGLVNGLKAQQKAIEAQMLAIARGMQAAIKRALGIKSPSRVMRLMGMRTGQGLALGIAGQARDVAAASRGLAKASLVGYQSFRPGSVPSPTASTPGVRVFIGDRELTDIVRTEVDTSQTGMARQLAYGRRI